MRQRTCNGTGAQQRSGRCLDAVGQGTASGALLQLWNCYGGGGTRPHQVWSLR